MQSLIMLQRDVIFIPKYFIWKKLNQMWSLKNLSKIVSNEDPSKVESKEAISVAF